VGNPKKTFAVLGVSGYVAPKHVAAITALGHKVVAACDPTTSGAGYLDNLAPDVFFHTDMHGWVRHMENMGLVPDYLVICTPNYLHFDHLRLAAYWKCNAIVEKPLVLFPDQVEWLQQMQKDAGIKVWTISQLKLYQGRMKRFKIKLADAEREGRPLDIQINYVTPRGMWYHRSWKGKLEQSGGLAFNIGIHLFDVLVHHLGLPRLDQIVMHGATNKAIKFDLHWEAGHIAKVELSVSRYHGGRTYVDAERVFRVDDENISFKGNFMEGHLQSYQRILEGSGFTLEQTLPGLQVAAKVRESAERMMNASGMRDAYTPPPPRDPGDFRAPETIPDASARDLGGR